MHRRFFLAVAGGVLGYAGAVHALAAPPLRRLRLVNANTKETFDGPYRDDLGPIGMAIDELSLLLRDHHSGEQIAIDVGVIDFLAVLMDAIGATRATVLSAYRGVATNQALARTTFGVADNSQHLYGRALDIRFDTRLEDSVRIARSMKRGGVGWYPRSGFIHIDTGPVRNWTLDDRNLDHLLLPLHQLVAGAGPKNWASDSAIGSSGTHLNDFATGKTVSLPGGQDRLAIGRAFDDFLKHPIDRRLPLRAASRKALR
jgi:uncharacterized protein YcbK (DUF882 family)